MMTRLMNKWATLIIFALLLTACQSVAPQVENIISPTIEAEMPASTQNEEPGSMNNNSSSNGMGGNNMGANERENAGNPPALFSGRTSRSSSGDAGQDQAVEILVSIPDFNQHLAQYSDWTSDGWQDEEGSTIWSIDFYSEAADEWLGWGQVDIATGEVLDQDVPLELSAEAFQSGQERIKNYVLADAEMLALLGNPDEWEYYIDYDRYDKSWYMGFYRGLDEWAAIIYFSDDSPRIDEIVDPSALDAEEQLRVNQDQAIELAFEAVGVYDAIDGVDNWHAYVVPDEGSQYGVSFASAEGELFFALVDIDAWEIIETNQP